MSRAAATFLLSILFIASSTVMAAERRNVLFIAVDDLNDWIGALGGHPQVKTPNIDRLAKRGVIFTNAHCQAPLCNPSRTSLLTGLRPSTTGVYALDPWFRTSPPLKDIVTLPQHFAAHGYVTQACGKIFHDAYPPPENRTDGSEFDEWGFHHGSGPFPATKFVKTQSKSKGLDWGAFPARDEEQDDSKVADWAIAKLKAEKGPKPFFLSVGFRRPHLPCFAPQKWFELYPDESLVMPAVKADDRADVPAFAEYLHWHLPEPRLGWLQQHNQWRPLVRAYLASVSFMDSQVGRVLDALDEGGMADNTIIVFWSDHGWHLGEKGMTGKTTLWERSTHVPLIFAGPGISQGRCSRPAELLDIYPTLIELCALPAKEGLEGQSLTAQLKDVTAARTSPAITTHGQNNHSIRTEEWRYIRYADGSEELYDEKADPNEWTNLASDPKFSETKAQLVEWLPKVNKPPIPGSVTRLVEIRDGKVWWEGEPIDPADHQK